MCVCVCVSHIQTEINFRRRSISFCSQRSNHQIMHLISRCRGGLFREWFTLSPSLFLFSFSLVHFLIPYLAVQFLSPSPTHLHYLTQSVSFSLLHTARWIVFGKMTSPVYYQGKSPPSDSFTLLDIISLKYLQHAKRYFHIRCCDSFSPPPS